ncbi:MAG: hypothetical protein ACTSYA_03985 [Candidatus Kariarchaeaceae archaeon]
MGLTNFFRRKKISSPPFIEETEWMKASVEALGLKKGTYSILPVYGGVLIYILKEGISWIPKAKITGIIKKSTLNKAIREGSKFGFSVIDEIIPIPFNNIKNTVSKDLLKQPPDYSVSWLQSMINWVEIIPRERYSEFFDIVDDRIEKVKRKKEQESEDQEEVKENESGALFIAEKSREAEFVKQIKEKLTHEKSKEKEEANKKDGDDPLIIGSIKQGTKTVIKGTQSAIGKVVSSGKKVVSVADTRVKKIRSKVVSGRGSYHLYRFSNDEFYDHFTKALKTGGIKVIEAPTDDN